MPGILSEMQPALTKTEGQAPRWTRRKQARPAEIMEAALVCFAERGFAATRLEEIAQRAGVTKGTIYLYFADKEALFRAAIEQSLSPTLDHLASAAEGAPTAGDALRQIILGLAGKVAGSPLAAIPKVIVSEAGNFPALAEFYFEHVVLRGLAILRGIIERGIASGEFRGDLVTDLIAFHVVAPVLMGLLWQKALAPFDPDPKRIEMERVAATEIELLLRGLRP